MTTSLSLLCGYTKPDEPHSYPCQRRAIDASGRCYSHSPLRAEQRRRNSSKGGRLGGRGRASISKDLGELRRLIGSVVELKAQDSLPNHLDYHLKDFISLLRLYVTYTQLEIRTTTKTEDLQSRRAFDQERLIDADSLKENIEALVHLDDAHDEYVQDDEPDYEGPDPKGAA